MAFNLSDIGSTAKGAIQEVDSLRKEFSGFMNEVQTIEKQNAATKFRMQHNLYNLLGDVVMGSIKNQQFNQPDAEGYIKELFDLQLMIDFENRYGVKMGTGPSKINPGTRDYNIKFTRNF